MLTPPKKVVVKQSPGKGFGVFAADKIIKGELIERCYCITIGNNIPNSLENYAFSYPPGNEEHNFSVLPLGYGSVYNHSDENNAHWIKTPDVEMHFDFIAFTFASFACAFIVHRTLARRFIPTIKPSLAVAVLAFFWNTFNFALTVAKIANCFEMHRSLTRRPIPRIKTSLSLAFGARLRFHFWQIVFSFNLIIQVFALVLIMFSLLLFFFTLRLLQGKKKKERR